MNDLSPFMAFWLGYNTAQRANGMPDILYGEAHDLWQEALEIPENCRHSVHPRSDLSIEDLT